MSGCGRASRIALVTLFLAVGMVASGTAHPTRAAEAIVPVKPMVETAPVTHDGDSADDPAIWIHPSDPAQSLIIGTDKANGGGLTSYNLDGSIV